MIAAGQLDRQAAKLLAISANGTSRHLGRADLASLLRPGDLVIANDAATLPASLHGSHDPTAEPIEIRLAGWVSASDPERFVAIAFGAGDYHTPTENRTLPPPLAAGDRLTLGPLRAIVEHSLDHPRLFQLRFLHRRKTILAGLARYGRPIQYAYVEEQLALWDVWTRIAVEPFAFEAPSAGFCLDWRTVAAWRDRHIAFATLTHAAGISSTGDPALEERLPFDEPYRIPHKTAGAIARVKEGGGRIVAVGTSVVRALESAVTADGKIRAGNGVACGRIGRETTLRVVDAILTGVHLAGESHFELLRAFADDAVLDRMSATLADYNYRCHEFGDSVLLERQVPS